MKSITIKAALLTISLVTLVLSVAVSVIAVQNLHKVNDGANELYDDIIPGIFNAEEMNVALGDLRISGAEHLMATTDEEQAASEKDAAEAIKAFNEALNIYKGTIPASAEEELKDIQSIEKDFQTYLSLNQRYTDHSKASQDTEASQIFRTEMDQIYFGMGDKLDKLMDKNSVDATSVNDSNDAIFAQSKLLIGTISGVLIASALGLAAFAVFGIIKPLAHSVGAMTTLAEGNLETQVPYTDRTNELGAMAKAVQVFKDNSKRARQLEAEQAAMKAQAEADRKATMLKMADDLESAVGSVINIVSSASTEMQSSAQSLSATAEETSRQASTVAMTTEQASENVQTVASATEELSSSIAEISSQVNRSTRIATEAVHSAQETDKKMLSLVESVRKIDVIVQMINDIANQTNLLALNATIEAARAGDAGKGFAVVANEVKSLAAETAKATDEIVQQINEIQQATQQSAEAIKVIGGTVNDMSVICQSIAAAVEEQTVATKNIAQNVQQVASGTDEVSRNINDVSQAAGETGAAASQILGASDELAKQSVTLRQEVGNFLTRIRAA